MTRVKTKTAISADAIRRAIPRRFQFRYCQSARRTTVCQLLVGITCILILVGTNVQWVNWAVVPQERNATVTVPAHFRGTTFKPRLQCQHSRAPPSQSHVILVASHLRQGSDGEMRLRIIDHNLRLLSSEGEDDAKQKKPLKAIVIFSYDGPGVAVRAMVDEWRGSAGQGAAIEDVLFVKNDAVLVDAAKWTLALYTIFPAIRRTKSRVMLLNDSFLLTRHVPELWDDSCGGVCGLVWTAAAADPSRHVQSYIRSLSSCEAESYVQFYEASKASVQNVHELIQLFEINLRWAEGGTFSAIYEYAGEHPDNDKAQQALIAQGYPAIKLKKFFVTDDPWLSEDEVLRPRLPPSFSADVYRKLNHDLNHLGVDELENHFAAFGKNEARVYSSRPLIVKKWLGEELSNLKGVEGHFVHRILEDYLTSLNASMKE